MEHIVVVGCLRPDASSRRCSTDPIMIVRCCPMQANYCRLRRLRPKLHHRWEMILRRGCCFDGGDRLRWALCAKMMCRMRKDVCCSRNSRVASDGRWQRKCWRQPLRRLEVRDRTINHRIFWIRTKKPNKPPRLVFLIEKPKNIAFSLYKQKVYTNFTNLAIIYT